MWRFLTRHCPSLPVRSRRVTSIVGLWPRDLVLSRPFCLSAVPADPGLRVLRHVACCPQGREEPEVPTGNPTPTLMVYPPLPPSAPQIETPASQDGSPHLFMHTSEGQRPKGEQVGATGGTSGSRLKKAMAGSPEDSDPPDCRTKTFSPRSEPIPTRPCDLWPSAKRPSGVWGRLYLSH